MVLCVQLRMLLYAPCTQVNYRGADGVCGEVLYNGFHEIINLVCALLLI